MTTERRHQQRIHCFLSTSTPKGDVFIDELSSEGGRLTAAFEAAPGERLPLTFSLQGGGELKVEIQVARVLKISTGYRMGWTFKGDAASRDQAGRLFRQVTLPNLAAKPRTRTTFARSS